MNQINRKNKNKENFFKHYIVEKYTVYLSNRRLL